MAMLLSRPPATRRQRITSAAGGVDIVRPSDRVQMIGIVFEADGNFAAIDSDTLGDADPSVVTTNPVKAGEFWAVDVAKLDATTTALPLVILWGPIH